MSIHMINDPIHGAVVISKQEGKYINKIIDHELFQRLRYIKQNGLGDMVYPGATHTRFSHCIGASWIAKKIMDKFQIDFEKKIEKKGFEKYKKLILKATLLHDIGHGPFSHAFEAIFEGKIRHEDWTEKFVSNILGNDKDIDNVVALINNDKKKSKLPNFLFDIVSSQLDVDRMDYLLRDSHFCGVTFGNYDPDRMIHCLAIAFRKADTKKWRLGIKQKGIGVIEHYLMARRLMTLNVYYHKKKCAIEFLLGELLLNLCNLTSEKRDKYILDKNLNKFISLAGKLKNGKLNKLKFIEKAFSSYSKLTDATILNLMIYLKEKDPPNLAVTKISKNLILRKLPQAFLIDPSIYNAVKIIIDDFTKTNKLKPWQMTLEITTNFYSYKGDYGKKIFVVNSDDSLADYNLTDDSKIARSFSDQSDKIIYLYINHDVKNERYIKDLTEKLKKINLNIKIKNDDE